MFLSVKYNPYVHANEAYFCYTHQSIIAQLFVY